MSAWQRATIGRSTASYVSKIRLWIFCFEAGLMGHSGTCLSASPLQARLFLSFFRSPSSAGEYLKAVRWLYTFCDRPLGFGGFSWESPAVSQALRGGKKEEQKNRAPKVDLSWDDTATLAFEAERCRDPAIALAFRFASAFLLRCQSELLRIDAADLRQRDASESARGVPALGIVLHRRKNRPQGSTLWRECICAKRPELCVLHWTLTFFKRRGFDSVQGAASAGRVFDFSYSYLVSRLRAYALQSGLPEAARRCSHEFRRGTARELLRAGTPLCVVLRSGEWSSAAYRAYIDMHEVDQLAIFDAIAELSDDEDAPGGVASSQARPAPKAGSKRGGAGGPKPKLRAR